MDRFEYAAESAETEFQKHLTDTKMYRGSVVYRPSKAQIQSFRAAAKESDQVLRDARKMARQIPADIKKAVNTARRRVPVSQYNSKGPAPISGSQAVKKSLR
jgi:hypothetical protein